MRISDWSSDVCSSDLALTPGQAFAPVGEPAIVAVGDLANELVGSGKLRGADHLLVVDPFALQHDILAHRSRQEQRFLHGAADLAAQADRDRKSTRLNSSH